MARRCKFRVGERVQVYCERENLGNRIQEWVWGTVTSVDQRMVEIECEADVYDALGYRRPDRRLWCTHGSRHLRRPDEANQP